DAHERGQHPARARAPLRGRGRQPRLPPRTDSREAGRGDSRVLRGERLDQYERLAVFAGDLRGLPGRPALAPRRARAPARRRLRRDGSRPEVPRRALPRRRPRSLLARGRGLGRRAAEGDRRPAVTTLDRLIAAGLSPAEAARKETLFESLGPGEHRFFVPGRIEVLGKHTDYAGGRSLLGA